MANRVYKLKDSNGNVTRFTEKSDTAIEVESFRRDGHSMGWPTIYTREDARKYWSSLVKKHGHELAN